MGTVHKLETTNKHLDDLVYSLNEGYDTLNELYTRTMDIELRLSGLESRYETRLKKFIEAVGIENVPAEYLDYSVEFYTEE